MDQTRSQKTLLNYGFFVGADEVRKTAMATDPDKK